MHRWVLHRRAGLWVALLLTMLALLGVPQLRADFLPRTLYAYDAARSARLEAFKSRFADDDHRIVWLAHADQPLDSRQLAELAELEQRGRALPEVRGSTSLFTLPGLALPVPTEAELPTLRERVAAHPLAGGVLLDASGRTAAVAFAIDPDDPAAVDRAVDALEAQAQHCETLSCTVTGPAVLRRHVVQLLVREQLRLVPAAGLVLVLLLGWWHRSARAVVTLLVPTTLGTLWTVGAMGWAGQPLNVVNAVLPAILLVIGVADAMHLDSAWQHRRQHADGLVRTFTEVGPACLLTTATTMLGFGSLSLASLPVLRAFGITAAAAVAALLLATLCTLPTLLPWVPPARPRSSSTVVALAQAAQRRRWAVLAVALLVAGLGAAGALRLRVDNRVLEYLPDGGADAEAAALWQRVGGVAPFEVAVAGRGDDPALLAALGTLQAQLEALDFVHYTASVADVLATVEVPDGARLLGADSAVRYRLAKAAGWTRGLVSEDEQWLRVVVRGEDLGTRSWLEREGEVEALVASALDGTAPGSHLTGIAPGSYRGAQRLVRDLMLSLTGAFAVIWVLIGVQLRSWRLALASILPNALPVLVAMGALGWWGGTLQIPSAITFGVALGIAVDDTIHLLHAWSRRGRLEDWAGPGHAVWRTTVVLAGGFSVLLASRLPANRTFGGLCVAMFAVALLADLVVLPALLPDYGSREEG